MPGVGFWKGLSINRTGAHLLHKMSAHELQ